MFIAESTRKLRLFTVQSRDPGSLVYPGCHNKISPTGWLKQQTSISHSFGGLEVQDQGARRFDS